MAEAPNSVAACLDAVQRLLSHLAGLRNTDLDSQHAFISAAAALTEYRDEAEAVLADSPDQWSAWQEGAIADIAAERRRQIRAEGWTPEHDDGHSHGQMAGAAAVYAQGAQEQAIFGLPQGALYGLKWPWDGAPKWKGQRENLVRAGALIAAEIERLDRAAS